MSDKASITEEEREAQLAEESAREMQEKNDLYNVLNTPEGMRVYSRIIEKGGLFTCKYTGNAHVHFNEGARNIVLQLFAEAVQALKGSKDQDVKIASLLLKLNIQGEV